MTALERLDARLHEQIHDVAHLRGALDVQMNRISQLYDHEGYAPRIEHSAIATAGTAIREGRRSEVQSRARHGT